MSAVEKIYDLLSDIECTDVFLNNDQKLKLAEYLAKKDVVPVVHCVDCKHARVRDKHEREYLVNGVLICTNPEVYEDGWGTVWLHHFCKYGQTMPMIKASEAMKPVEEEDACADCEAEVIGDEICEDCMIRYSEEDEENADK